MELDNILFMGVIIIAFLLPVLYFIISKKKAEAALKNSLGTKLGTFGLRLGEFEILGEKIIGFNDAQTHLFYYQKNNKQTDPIIIDLTKYSSCRAITAFTRAGNPGAESSVIQKVELEFEPKTKGAAQMSVLLFDMFADLQLQGELQMAENWRQKINTRLQN